ncbi:MAG TPA: hypothetical protein VFU63_09155 [Ktedonobacterales bacterium]|nr:hypothetical protein [Ktedonobacterales bacterium]
MTRSARHQHRHHKRRKLRRAIQVHAGGGRPTPEGMGLQLPRRGFMPNIGFHVTSYPKGWTFNRFTPGRTAVLVSGGGVVLMIVLCIVLATLRGS